MTGFKSKRAAALDEEGMYLVHQTDHSEDILHMVAQEREVLEMALEALERYQIKRQDFDTFAEAITAIKEALAQPAQEPVAWGVFEGNLHDMFFSQEEAQKMADLKGTHAEVRPLYATSQRTWVGLTDEEVQDFVSALWPVGVGAGKLLRAIEAKLKEKNNG
jgi:hypothetical protein